MNLGWAEAEEAAPSMIFLSLALVASNWSLRWVGWFHSTYEPYRTRTVTVRGPDTAQKYQNRELTTSVLDSASKSKNGRAKKDYLRGNIQFRWELSEHHILTYRHECDR